MPYTDPLDRERLRGGKKMLENKELSLPEIIRRLKVDAGGLHRTKRRSVETAIASLEAIELQARGVLDSISDIEMPPAPGALLTELLETLTGLPGEKGES